MTCRIFKTVALLLAWMGLLLPKYDRLASGGVARLEYEDGLVTLQAEDASVGQLLDEISQAAGIKIYLFEPVESHRRVSVQFSRSPVSQVLMTILEDVDHAVLYGRRSPSERIENYRRTARGGEVVSGQASSDSLEDSLSATSVFEEAGAAGGNSLDDRSKWGTTREEKEDLHPESDRSLHEEEPVHVSSSAAGRSGGSVVPLYGKKDARAAGPSGRGGEPQFPTSARPFTIYDQIEYLEKRIASGVSDAEYEGWLSVRGEEYVIHDRERLEYYLRMLEEQ